MVNDHKRHAAPLPGNRTPDVPGDPLPDDHAERIMEFLRRLAQTRGKYGRDQIRAIELEGWPGFGVDLDHIDRDRVFQAVDRAENKRLREALARWLRAYPHAALLGDDTRALLATAKDPTDEKG